MFVNQSRVIIILVSHARLAYANMLITTTSLPQIKKKFKKKEYTSAIRFWEVNNYEKEVDIFRTCILDQRFSVVFISFRDVLYVYNLREVSFNVTTINKHRIKFYFPPARQHSVERTSEGGRVLDFYETVACS